jgi:hypothetical protein
LAPALSTGTVAASAGAASGEAASGALADLAPHPSASRDASSSPVAACRVDALGAHPARIRRFPEWMEFVDEDVMAAAA